MILERVITKSDRVRASAFRESWLLERAAELHEPLVLHRKLWEFAVVAQTYLEHQECSEARGNVLGFGVGREPMAAWFATQGANVVATDNPVASPNWSSNQYAASRHDLLHEEICPEDVFVRRVTFRPVDMTDIPDGLRQGHFDLTWSCGSFEHLGSREAGLTFFLKQMECLKPGGLAVHTTEFNPHKGRTLETENIVLFQQRDIKELEDRLEQHGDRLWSFDATVGNEEVDQHIDHEPWGLPHLSIRLGSWSATSIVLIAQRG